MSPEMLTQIKSLRSGYGQEHDIWCLGILLFSMVHGHHPFSSKSKGETDKMIKGRLFKMDESLTGGLIDLISKMLKVDKSKRLDIDQVLNHHWTRKKLMNVKIYTPYEL